MRFITSRKGFALVTSLMLTLVSLTIVMALLYMITQGTKLSGLHKKYRTALEASYGGAEIYTKEILPFVMRNYSSATLTTDLQNSFTAVSLQVQATQSCLQTKLTKATSAWPAACSKTFNSKDNPDIRYTMESTVGNPFYVYSKIVDTVNGNTDVSGLQLEGAGVAESQSVLTPQHFPYIYRVEIQGERASNSTAQANIEVLYAY
ncbi:MAG: hypothetical protein HYV06_00395 [Deltaproteobacteria bacterium]|nr:hypothetical protein [Deltaproteobacteria bacterium]